MRHAVRNLAWLGVAGWLGGCDVLWAPYVADYPLCDASDPTLVLCLPFEGELVDGSRYQIPITGGPVATYVAGAVGRAAHFDAQTPPIVLGHNSAWGLSEFTLEAWVYPDALPTSRFGLMDREGGFSMFLYKNPDRNDLSLGCSSSDTGVQGLQIPIGTFSHIACTFKSGEQVLYLNGQPELHDGQPMKSSSAEPLPHHLGSNVLSVTRPEPDALVGALDELRFFAKSRSADEIQAAYERHAPVR